eukprot:COSAG06_NODE_3631_length_5096_cov_5.007004_6_plen_197_part_00
MQRHAGLGERLRGRQPRRVQAQPVPEHLERERLLETHWQRGGLDLPDVQQQQNRLVQGRQVDKAIRGGRALQLPESELLRLRQRCPAAGPVPCRQDALRRPSQPLLRPSPSSPSAAAALGLRRGRTALRWGLLERHGARPRERHRVGRRRQAGYDRRRLPHRQRQQLKLEGDRGRRRCLGGQPRPAPAGARTHAQL